MSCRAAVATRPAEGAERHSRRKRLRERSPRALKEFENSSSGASACAQQQTRSFQTGSADKRSRAHPWDHGNRPCSFLATDAVGRMFHQSPSARNSVEYGLCSPTHGFRCGTTRIHRPESGPFGSLIESQRAFLMARWTLYLGSTLRLTTTCSVLTSLLCQLGSYLQGLYKPKAHCFLNVDQNTASALGLECFSHRKPHGRWAWLLVKPRIKTA